MSAKHFATFVPSGKGVQNTHELDRTMIPTREDITMMLNGEPHLLGDLTCMRHYGEDQKTVAFVLDQDGAQHMGINREVSQIMDGSRILDGKKDAFDPVVEPVYGPALIYHSTDEDFIDSVRQVIQPRVDA